MKEQLKLFTSDYYKVYENRIQKIIYLYFSATHAGKV